MKLKESLLFTNRDRSNTANLPSVIGIFNVLLTKILLMVNVNAQQDLSKLMITVRDSACLMLISINKDSVSVYLGFDLRLQELVYKTTTKEDVTTLTKSNFQTGNVDARTDTIATKMLAYPTAHYQIKCGLVEVVTVCQALPGQDLINNVFNQ